MFMTGFECLACGKQQPLSFDGYTCPDCGNNLDVLYDYEGIREQLGHEYPFPGERDDVFKYAPFLPLESIDMAPPLRIGATPLYPAGRLGESIGLKHVFLKDDGLNPSASFKDRASSVTLAKAREKGVSVVSGASTGNAGSSMACMAASVEMPCVIFVPEKAPPAKIAQLLIFGAKVMAVRGTYDEAFDLCLAVCERKGWFNRNTGYNPFTREGKKTCSFEICEQLGWDAPDWIVVPTGDGNIISGIWKGLRDLYAAGLIQRLPRLLCAQSEASSAISGAVWKVQEGGMPEGGWSSFSIEPVAATTVADSISVDVPRDGLAAVRAVIESKGKAVTVPDEAILAAIPEVARGAGVFAEPAATCAWAALKKAAGEGLVKKDERVVCLLTGNGLKDVASARKTAGEPISVDPDVDAAVELLSP